MPTQGLSTEQVKMLTLAFYAVLFILCGVTVWNSVQIADMPYRFVTIEQSQVELAHTNDTFCRIDDKLTTILMKLK